MTKFGTKLPGGHGGHAPCPGDTGDLSEVIFPKHSSEGVDPIHADTRSIVRHEKLRKSRWNLSSRCQ